MTAAEARLRTENAKRSSDANREIRIRTTMNRLFEQMREKAAMGQCWIYFNDLTTFLIDKDDYAEIRERLYELGYIHTTDTYGDEKISW
jgi:hypothetical protein